MGYWWVTSRQRYGMYRMGWPERNHNYPLYDTAKWRKPLLRKHVWSTRAGLRVETDRERRQQYPGLVGRLFPWHKKKPIKAITTLRAYRGG